MEISNNIRKFHSHDFLNTVQNVILIGNPSVGKTHTTIALGIRAYMAGKFVLILQALILLQSLRNQ